MSNNPTFEQETREANSRGRSIPLIYDQEPETHRTILRRNYRSGLPNNHPDLQDLSIPEEDLRVIEKIYHKKYENCGRKRGALLRYIKFFKETQEPKSNYKTFLQFLKRKAIRNER